MLWDMQQNMNGGGNGGGRGGRDSRGGRGGQGGRGAARILRKHQTMQHSIVRTQQSIAGHMSNAIMSQSIALYTPVNTITQPPG